MGNNRSSLKKEFSVGIQYLYQGGCSMREAAQVNHKDTIEQVWEEHVHSWGSNASFYTETKGWQKQPGWAVVVIPDPEDNYWKEVEPKAVAGKDFSKVTLESLGVTPETAKDRSEDKMIIVLFFAADVEKFDNTSGYRVLAVQRPN